MPILYSVVTRGPVVLAKHAECIGNFVEVTEQITSMLADGNHKVTYSHGDYFIHLICENGLVYMCICEQEFDRTSAFLFLAEIKQSFIQTYGLQVATASAYAMNSEFSKVLADKMNYYSNNRASELISGIYGQIDELREVTVNNIDNLRDRGEKLELLINKTEKLCNSSVQFRQTSRTLARRIFWRNARIYIIFGLVIALCLYVFISSICGGPTWAACFK